MNKSFLPNAKLRLSFFFNLIVKTAWQCLPAVTGQFLLPEYELRDEHLGHKTVETGLFVAQPDLVEGVVELALVLDALREDGVDGLDVGVFLLVLVHEVLERGGGAPISVLSEDSRSHLVQSGDLDRVWPFTGISTRHSAKKIAFFPKAQLIDI